MDPLRRRHTPRRSKGSYGTQVPGLVLDLHRKLPRRRKNQHARGARCSGFDEPLHQRQEKREGLPCSGLGAGHQVDAVQHRWINSALDWRRRLNPRSINARSRPDSRPSEVKGPGDGSYGAASNWSGGREGIKTVLARPPGAPRPLRRGLRPRVERS